MKLGNQIPDKRPLKKVERKLIQKCVGRVRISATIWGGDATITGMLGIERKPIVRCGAAVQGIRRVVDRLQVPGKINQNG